jgi:hypothetical protein
MFDEGKRVPVDCAMALTHRRLGAEKDVSWACTHVESQADIFKKLNAHERGNDRGESIGNFLCVSLAGNCRLECRKGQKTEDFHQFDMH